MNSVETSTAITECSRNEKIKAVCKSVPFYLVFGALCALALASAVIVVLGLVSALLSLINGDTAFGMMKIPYFVESGLGYATLIVLFGISSIGLVVTSVRGIRILKRVLGRDKVTRAEAITNTVLAILSYGYFSLMTYLFVSSFFDEESTSFIGVSANVSQCISSLFIAGIFGLLLAACVYGILYSVKLMKSTGVSSAHIHNLGKSASMLHLVSILKCVDCIIVGFILLLPIVAYPKSANFLDLETIFASLDLTKLYNGLGIDKIFESVSGIYNTIVMGMFGLLKGMFNGLGIGSFYESLDLPRISAHLAGTAPILAFSGLLVMAYGVAQIIMFSSFKRYFYQLTNAVDNENYKLDKGAPFVLPIIFTSLYAIGAVFMIINGAIVTAFFLLANALLVIFTSLFLRKVHNEIKVKNDEEIASIDTSDVKEEVEVAQEAETVEAVETVETTEAVEA